MRVPKHYPHKLLRISGTELTCVIEATDIAYIRAVGAFSLVTTKLGDGA